MKCQVRKNFPTQSEQYYAMLSAIVGLQQEHAATDSPRSSPRMSARKSPRKALHLRIYESVVGVLRHYESTESHLKTAFQEGGKARGAGDSTDKVLGGLLLLARYLVEANAEFKIAPNSRFLITDLYHRYLFLSRVNSPGPNKFDDCNCKTPTSRSRAFALLFALIYQPGASPDFEQMQHMMRLDLLGHIDARCDFDTFGPVDWEWKWDPSPLWRQPDAFVGLRNLVGIFIDFGEAAFAPR